MKIVIPVMDFGRAGGERVLSNLANELIDKGHDVTFVKPNNGSKPYYPTNAKIKLSKFLVNGNKLTRYITNLYNLVIECRLVKADVVIANYFITAYVAFLMPKKVLKLYYVQANEIKLNRRWMFKILALITYILPLKKIVNSESILPKYTPNIIGVVPAGIDIQKYRSDTLPKEFKGESKFKIGLIGRQEKHKGTKEIISILHLLPEDVKSHLGVNIAVYLPENEKSLLWDYKFYKIDSEDDLRGFYKECDLILAIGLIENGAFHYPCAEAMATKRLVISNYSPLVNTNSKLAIDNFDSDIILEKLIEALSFSSEDIHKEVEDNFKMTLPYAWSTVAEKFDGLIHRNIK
ncbi:glycosyltransferase family 4 protein [Shewanella baltica]|uniref:glycosyltransferase family 4 protein n=1 Tax=Shewanella baltica TaxID=62322 RepID=UPI00217E706A|nr:glycosyltransferase family 4 protein [Shewanella baltica]MCS6209213.1 glycosyltransferase family 4 protein [Shewanella baltica]